MLAAEHALHGEALFEVVARENELRRLAGRQNAAMVRALDAAEFGEVAAFGKVLGDELAETGPAQDEAPGPASGPRILLRWDFAAE